MRKPKKEMHDRFHRMFGKLAEPGLSEWKDIHERGETEHWKDMDEMHEVLHDLPGIVKALILEIADDPLSFEEIVDYLRRFPKYDWQMKKEEKRNKLGEYIKSHLEIAVEQNVFTKENGTYQLTPKGLEMASHMKEAIPIFIGNVFSPKMVSTATIVIHIILTAVKCGFGALFHSAGLLSDGIDNGVDTVSSVLVWLGIKFDREKLSSYLVIIMMFISLIGIAVASINKITEPAPVREGPAAFVVSGLCGILMLFLSIYQYVVGRRNSIFALMCQSVDSRNHFLTSLLVCFGIVLSILAQRRDAFWLYYADAGASIIIGTLIFKSAIELFVEMLKPGGEPKHVSHFMQKSQERMRRRHVFSWLSHTLKENAFTGKELEKLYAERFCNKAPVIFTLSGFGYNPQSSEDLHPYLDHYVKHGKLVLEDGKYRLVKNKPHI